MDNYKTIPIIGVDTQLLNDQSPDGLCEKIINLKPRGQEQSPFWTPFENIDQLKNEQAQNFTYSHGISNIKNAFWQIRNRVNEKFKSTTSNSLERLIVLCMKEDRCAIDVIDPINWTIVKSLIIPIKTGYDFTATRLKEITIINITHNNQPFKIYYLIDDLFLEQGWPSLPEMSFKQNQTIFSEADVTSGSAYGISQQTLQYYQIRYAFKLYDGSWVKHSKPSLIKVPSSATEFAYMVPEFTLDGYPESLLNKSFWETQISGISCFVSLPKPTIKEALDQGIFYELIFFPSIDKIPSSEWPTATSENVKESTISLDSWPLQRVLNIDPFSHHKISARVIDGYNQRLLIGGKSTDFALPNHDIKGVDTGNVLSDFLDVNTSSFLESNEYYDAAGNSTTQGNEDYIVNEKQASILFSPKQAQQVKASSIVSSQSPGLTQNAPHTEVLPNVDYTINHASYSGTDVLLQITTRQSISYGAPIIGQMRVQVEIGPTGGIVESVIQFTVTVNEIGQPLNISDFEIITGGVTNYKFYHQVTLITDNGEFTRTNEIIVANENTGFVAAPLLSYPDSRAISYKCILKNGANYEVVWDKKLTQHPDANYSYALLESNANDFTYTVGAGALTEAPSLAENDKTSYAVNLVQTSETSQPFTFDVKTVYRIGNKENDIIQGFAVNQIDISSGQFGQYPLYVFTTQSTWALEQASDPNVVFARLVPIDNRIGAISPHAITNADRTVVVIDKNYIYSLSGSNLQRIDRPISHDQEYTSFISEAKIAYHEADDYEELIFSNINYNYTWYYNLRFQRWYKGSETFKIFIIKQPSIQALSTSNSLLDFNTKIKNKNTAWELKTRPLNFGYPYIHKKLKRSIFRLFLKQENTEPYKHLRIKLYGLKENHTEPFILMDKYYDQEITKDIWLRMNYGSFQTFQIEMNGDSMYDNSSIHEFESEFQLRQRERIER